MVGLFHVLIIWEFAAIVRGHPSYAHAFELNVTVFNSGSAEFLHAVAAPPPPVFESPEPQSIVEPQIEVDPSDDSGTSRAQNSLMAPPRPDVAKPHNLPELPPSLRNRAGISPPVLKILILTDGNIGDAEIVRSSGDRTLDVLAASFVRENWHYLPAETSGHPVEDWITVIVHFMA